MTKEKKSRFNTLPLKEAALLYEEIGWSLFPLKEKDKAPLGGIKWGRFGKKRMTPEQIEAFWKDDGIYKKHGATSKNNIGLIAGAPGSDLVFFDADSIRIINDIDNGVLDLPDTVTSSTSEHKRHYIFKAKPGTVKNRKLIKPDDPDATELASIRAKIQYIVGVPSEHPDGGFYQYLPGRGPDEIEVAEFPDIITTYLDDLEVEIQGKNFEPTYEKKYQKDTRLQEYLSKQFKPKENLKRMMDELIKRSGNLELTSEDPRYIRYGSKSSKGKRNITIDKNNNYIYDNHPAKAFDSIGFVQYWLSWDFREALNMLCDLFGIERFQFGGKTGASTDDIEKANKILAQTLKSVEKDKTAIFAKDALDAATLLYIYELQLYHKYINALKELKIPDYKDLERAVKVKQKEIDREKSKFFGRDFEKTYTVSEGCINWNKGDQLICLCNADIRIIRNVVMDDGIDTTRLYELCGKTKNGKRLPKTIIPAKDYPSMRWVYDAYGTKFEMEPGTLYQGRLAAAITNLSQENEKEEIIYSHTGWRQRDDKDVYLHQGGAIALGGNDSNVKVDLSLGARGLPNATILNNFNLPPSPNGTGLEEAVRMTLAIVDLAPPGVSYPCLCSVFTAPLASLLRVDFALWIMGRTGIFKTELACLCQSHFGRIFDHSNQKNL